jgi:ATP-binding cassette, subfamily B, bacterial
MNYNLNKIAEEPHHKNTTGRALRKLIPYLGPEKKRLAGALVMIIFNTGMNLMVPFLIGHTIDKYVQTKQYGGILYFSGILCCMFILALIASYTQTRLMGGVGQRMLYTLRNAVFTKLQELPIAFFNQNKTGDLISRINNDTDKMNQFFSQSLMQFIGGIATMVGAGVFLLSINVKLGLATLAPGLLLLVFTRLISPWVKRKNAANMKSTGSMSSEIQESLQNFKVIIAFNRRDYFRKRFAVANTEQYQTAIGAGLVNNFFMPVFSLCANLCTIICPGVWYLSDLYR